ncbi:hypothetical protein MRX96_026452 [Rhipicephalus microplus]
MCTGKQEAKSGFCTHASTSCTARTQADALTLNYDVLTGDGGGRNTLPSDTPERSKSTGLQCDFTAESFTLLEGRREGNVGHVCSDFPVKSLSGGVVRGCGCNRCNGGVIAGLGGTFSSLCNRCERRY